MEDHEKNTFYKSRASLTDDLVKINQIYFKHISDKTSNLNIDLDLKGISDWKHIIFLAINTSLILVKAIKQVVGFHFM